MISGRTYYYIVTAAYEDPDTPELNGEGGLIEDRDESVEDPYDDTLWQILVDSCNSEEVSANVP